MNVGDASNSADDQANNEANDNNAVDGDGMPNTADVTAPSIYQAFTQLSTT